MINILDCACSRLIRFGVLKIQIRQADLIRLRPMFQKHSSRKGQWMSLVHAKIPWFVEKAHVRLTSQPSPRHPPFPVSCPASSSFTRFTPHPGSFHISYVIRCQKTASLNPLVLLFPHPSHLQGAKNCFPNTPEVAPKISETVVIPTSPSLSFQSFQSRSHGAPPGFPAAAEAPGPCPGAVGPEDLQDVAARIHRHGGIWWSGEKGGMMRLLYVSEY